MNIPFPITDRVRTMLQEQAENGEPGAQEAFEKFSALDDETIADIFSQPLKGYPFSALIQRVRMLLEKAEENQNNN